MMHFARFRILVLLAVVAGLGFFAHSAQAQTYNRFTPANGILVGDVSTYVTTAADSSDVISLWTGTCNASNFLRADGACATAISGLTSANIISLWTGTCDATTFLRGDGSCQSAGGGPTLSGTQTWTGVNTWSSTTPALRLFTTGAATDRKDIRLEASASGQLQLNSYTDAGSLMNSLIIASRASGGFTTATFGTSNGSNTLLGSTVNLATAGGTKLSINANGQATFAQPAVGGATVTVNGPSVSGLGLYVNAGTNTGASNGVQIDAGTNSSDQAIVIQDGSATTNFLTIDGAGSATMGNAATPQGPGTLNVTGGFYVNGVAVGASAAAGASATAGGSTALNPNSAAVPIALSTEEFDTGSFHDNSTNNSRVILPSATGYASCSAAVSIFGGTQSANPGSANAYTYTLYIRKNAGANGYIAIASDSYIRPSGGSAVAGSPVYLVASAAMIPANGTDYVEMYVYATGSFDTNGSVVANSGNSAAVTRLTCAAI